MYILSFLDKKRAYISNYRITITINIIFDAKTKITYNYIYYYYYKYIKNNSYLTIDSLEIKKIA